MSEAFLERKILSILFHNTLAYVSFCTHHGEDSSHGTIQGIHLGSPLTDVPDAMQVPPRFARAFLQIMVGALACTGVWPFPLFEARC